MHMKCTCATTLQNYNGICLQSMNINVIRSVHGQFMQIWTDTKPNVDSDLSLLNLNITKKMRKIH